MPSRADTTTRPAARLSRTAHPTPWSRPAPRRPDRIRAVRRPRPAPPPVFVDDSGRRRRAGRLLGTCLDALVGSYLAVVGLTFSGAPLSGRLAPPGVDQLSRPAGDGGLGVGPGAQESPLPPAAVASADAPSEGSGLAPDGADAPQAVDTQAPPAVPAAVTTTTATTVAPGQSTNSTVPTPGSTVPEHTQPTGGPPTEPPGKP